MLKNRFWNVLALVVLVGLSATAAFVCGRELGDLKGLNQGRLLGRLEGQVQSCQEWLRRGRRQGLKLNHRDSWQAGYEVGRLSGWLEEDLDHMQWTHENWTPSLVVAQLPEGDGFSPVAFLYNDTPFDYRKVVLVLESAGGRYSFCRDRMSAGDCWMLGYGQFYNCFGREYPDQVAVKAASCTAILAEDGRVVNVQGVVFEPDAASAAPTRPEQAGLPAHHCKEAREDGMAGWR